MKRWLIPVVMLGGWFFCQSASAAEITDIADAFDGDDPFDINIDVGFHSTLNRAKVTHEWKDQWVGDYRPDYNELRYQRKTYAMDYMVEIGLFHDLELYLNLPWVISDQQSIAYVAGVSGANSTLFSSPGEGTNSLAVDPADHPSTKRAGIGDMQLGLNWAIFNDERDDTKSVWILGLDLMIPTGSINDPAKVVDGKTGGVGMGHYVLTPSLLFSHRLKTIDPYFGLHGSIPLQGGSARSAGLVMPFEGGFLAGMELVAWENSTKGQKFAIDLRLSLDYVARVVSEGNTERQGTVNEIADFLVCPSCDAADPTSSRQFQAQTAYARAKIDLGFVVRATEFARLRFGASLAHHTEHFITGASRCQDQDGDNNCTVADQDSLNDTWSALYDPPGRRLRVEETTMLTWWLMGMLTF